MMLPASTATSGMIPPTLCQIPGTFRRIVAGLHRLSLDEYLVNRPARDAVRSRHRRMLDDRTINLSEQLPGWIVIRPSGVFSIFLHPAADVIGDFLVNILGFVRR